jgi:murein L,D-transpeptidase YafK
MPGQWGSLALIDRSLGRALMTAAALTAGGLLGGCNTDEVSLAANAKANQPVPPKLLAEMSEKDMALQSPILIRLFKQEAELEVWKQNRSGRFEVLKSYPICRWSGDLGPKVREGDRQAPEGFYSITPAQMNPQSAYYLSFNTGYPNAYDKALGHTGSQLMVHGDCSSRGCYAMTDEQIAEIYALGRESFFGGQRAFQFQAYPFRMTPINMAKHRNNPNMPFWRMIKEGYDHFEVTHQEPKVDFCEKKYVFDAAKPPNATRDPAFDAAAKCPAYVIPDEVAEAVRDKQRQDEAEYAKLIAKGTPVAKLNTGIDGGMNKVFAAKLPDGSTGLSEGGEGQSLSLLAMARAPGTIPAHVNPPKPNLSSPAPEELAAASVTTNSTAATRLASASPNEQSEGVFASLARKMGIGGTADSSVAAAPASHSVAKPKLADSKHSDAGPRVEKLAATKSTESKPGEPKQGTGKPALKPSVGESNASAASATTESPAKDSLLTGAQPVVSSSFESRFSAMK